MVFGADTEHVQSKPFTDVNSTNIIERFQGTLKDRTKVVRGFKNMDTARLLTEAWLVHYNFFKEHSTLGDVPPAVKMGITPIKDWVEVIKGGNADTEAISRSVTEMPMKHRLVIRKPRCPKRQPKNLKLKPRVEVSLIQIG